MLCEGRGIDATEHEIRNRDRKEVFRLGRIVDGEDLKRLARRVDVERQIERRQLDQVLTTEPNGRIDNGERRVRRRDRIRKHRRRLMRAILAQPTLDRAPRLETRPQCPLSQHARSKPMTDRASKSYATEKKPPLTY